MSEYLLYINEGYHDVEKWDTTEAKRVVNLDLYLTHKLVQLVSNRQKTLYSTDGQLLGDRFLKVDTGDVYRANELGYDEIGFDFVAMDINRKPTIHYNPTRFTTTIRNSLLLSKLVGTIIAECSSITPILYDTSNVVDVVKLTGFDSEELYSTCMGIMEVVDDYSILSADRIIKIEPMQGRFCMHMMGNHNLYRGERILT
jgi:hypothetical protein